MLQTPRASVLKKALRLGQRVVERARQRPHRTARRRLGAARCRARCCPARIDGVSERWDAALELPRASTASRWTARASTPSTRRRSQRRRLRRQSAPAKRAAHTQQPTMGNVPSLKMEVVPADPVTWWLDEVKALRNEYQKRASDQWSFAASKNNLEVFLKRSYRTPRRRKTLSSTRSSRGSRTSGRTRPTALLGAGGRFKEIA